MPKISKHRYHGLENGYRSGLEEGVAKDLKKRGISARYEEVKIKYTKPSKLATYTPDFVISLRAMPCPACSGRGCELNVAGESFNMPCDRCAGKGEVDRKIFIETKGRFVTADRQKHLLIKEQHPELDIRFLFQNSCARISKTSKTTYAAWCEKHGFLFADKRIPDSWLLQECLQ